MPGPSFHAHSVKLAFWSLHTLKCVDSCQDVARVTTTTRTMKTTIITSVSAFIRQRSAQQSFPLAAGLNRALVGSTCHMGGSRGGGGEKGVLFVQANLSSISLLPPKFSSLSGVVCSGTRFALRRLYTLLLHAAKDCSKFQILA